MKRLIIALYKTIKQILMVIGFCSGLVLIMMSLAHMLGIFCGYFITGHLISVSSTGLHILSSKNFILEWNIFLFESAAWSLLTLVGLAKLVHSNLPPKK